MRLAAVIFSMFAVMAVARPCSAAVDYFPSTNTIVVNNYRRELPCTPKILYAADKIYGWRKVQPHESSDMMVIEANLQIGTGDGADTYFNLGVGDDPTRTLLMRGNLTVYPAVSDDARDEGRQGVSRLTIGTHDGEGAAPALKFDCRQNARFGLYVGCFLDDGTVRVAGRGAQLVVRGGVISSAAKNSTLSFGGLGEGRVYLKGDVVTLENAVISRTSGTMLYGLPVNDPPATVAILRDSTFAHAPNAIVSGRNVFEGCVFEGFQRVVDSEGPLSIIFRECVFRNNETNWRLIRPDAAVVCVDCHVEPPTNGDVIGGGEGGASFTEKRHVVLSVVDHAGEPVPGATYVVSSVPLDPAAVVNGRGRVGVNGRTPGKDQPDRAVLLTCRRVTPFPGDERKRAIEYLYEIVAEAPGFKSSVVKRFAPKHPWEMVPVILRER